MLNPLLKISLNVAFSFLLTSCAVSVHPIILESEATFDPQLLGTWEDIANSDRAVVSRGAGNLYAIEYTKAGKSAKFEARLGRLRDHMMLDVWAAPRRGEMHESYKGVLIPAHLFFVLDVKPDEVAMAVLDPDSLLAALRSGQIRLPYRQSKNEFTLTGTTEELRSALGPYLERPGALPKREKWNRARRSTTNAPYPVDIPCFEASAWREADQLFLRDSYWRGADGASSVYLGGGRTLWLFGDTWIDPSGNGTRNGARMVSNSVAIQTGTDPANASMKFYWGRASDGTPSAIIPDEGKERHWFGNGIRVGDCLVLFLNRVISVNTGLGFESVGWVAWMVENPDAEPSHWRKRRLQTPTNPLGVLTGFAAVRQFGDYVYAFGSEDPVKSHPIYASRWPAEKVRLGQLMSPEWWGGERLGWISDSSSAARFPLFENGQSELSIHFDQASDRFIGIQTAGFGPTDIMMRAAPLHTGPWSSPKLVYRPSEYNKPNIMIYSAKAHPQLTGGDLILTYATNNFDFGAHLTDSLSYFPRFVRLMRCR